MTYNLLILQWLCVLIFKKSIAYGFDDNFLGDYGTDFSVMDDSSKLGDHEYFRGISSSQQKKLPLTGERAKTFEWMDQIFIITSSERETILSKVSFNTSSVFLEEIGEIATIQNVSAIEVVTSGTSLYIVQGSVNSAILLINTVKSTMNGMQVAVAKGFALPGKFRDISLLAEQDGSVWAALSYQDQIGDTFVKFFGVNDKDMEPISVADKDVLVNATVELFRDDSTFLGSFSNGTHCQLLRLNLERKDAEFLHEPKICSNPWIVMTSNDETVLIHHEGPNLELHNVLEYEVQFSKTYDFPNLTDVRVIHDTGLLLLLSKDVASLLSLETDNYEEIWKQPISCLDGMVSSIIELQESIVIVFNCSSFLSFTSLQLDVHQSDEAKDEGLEEEIQFLHNKLDVCISDWTQEMSSTSQQVEELLKLKTIYEQYKEEDETTWGSGQTSLSFETSLSRLSEKFRDLWKRLQAIQTQIPNLLSYSGNQTISSPIHAENLFVDAITIDSGHIETINSVPLTTYDQDYLRLDVPQEIKGKLSFNVLSAVNATVLNLYDDAISFRPEDLMRYDNPEQIVRGHHRYSSILLTGDSVTTINESIGSINGIPSSEFAHKGTSLELFGDKEFTAEVSIEQLKLDQLNDVSYDEWFDDFQFPEKTKIFSKPLTIHGDVEVSGNVYARDINGINLTDVYQNSVKPFNFAVDGPVEFLEPVEITGRFRTKDINGIPWKDILLNTDEEVKAVLHIEKAHIGGNLESASINGLDFQRDVYSKKDNQRIEGFKIFVSDLVVTGSEGVKLEDGATINGIDPSSDVRFSKNKDTLILHKPIQSDTLEILGNLKVSNLNGEKFPEFQHDFWRKSVPQVINVPMSTDKINVRGNVLTEMINGIKTSRYVTSSSDQILTGSNIFLETVEVKKFNVAEGKKIDGVDLTQLDEIAVSVDKYQNLQNKAFFEEINVDSLEVRDGNLNGVSLDTLFHKENPILKGRVSFQEAVTAESVHGPKTWSITNFNGHNLEDIVQHRTPHVKAINGSMEISELEVDSIEVDGIVNGIDFDAWKKDAVFKTNSESRILNRDITVDGKVTFEDLVEFNRINGFSWEEYSKKIVEDDAANSVSGSKTFLQPLKVRGDLTVDKVNGINFSELISRILVKDKDQTITGKYEFAGSLFTKDAHVEKINEVTVDNIVLVDQPIRLRGRTAFLDEVTFGNLSAPNSWLGGCNLQQALLFPKFNSKFDFSDNFSVGHIEVEGNVTSSGPFMTHNKKNHMDVVRSLVRKSKSHTIHAPVVFKNLVVLENFSSEIINDVHLGDLLSSDTTKDIILKCPLNFTSSVQVDHIRSDSIRLTDNVILNGIKIEDFKMNGISKASAGRIYGRKTYKGDIFVRDNLRVKNFNGMPTEKLLHRDSQCSSNKLILNSMLVDGHFNDQTSHTKETVAAKVFNNLVDFNFLDNRIITNLNVKGGIITKDINGIELSDVVKFESEHQILTGHKTFHHMTLDGELHTKNINNIPIEQLFDFRSWPSKQVVLNSENRTLNSSNLAKVYKHQQYNKRLEKYLHLQFESLMVVSHMNMSHVLWGKSANSGMFFIVEKYDLDCGEDECACSFVTHTLQITNDMVEGIESQFGIYITLDSSPAEYLFDFTLSCAPGLPLTTVRALHMQDGVNASHVLEEEILHLGIIVKVEHFASHGFSYFVVASVSKVNLDEQEVNAFRGNPSGGFTMIKNFGMSAGFDLHQIDGRWNLVLIKNIPHQINSKSEVVHYVWKKYRQQFELVSSYPSQPISKVLLISSFDHHFMIIGHDCNPLFKNVPSCFVQVYKKSSDELFKLDHLIERNHATDLTAFTVDYQLYLSVASFNQTLGLYKLIYNEGFQEIASLSFPVSSTIYIEYGESHYLLGISQKNGITLLRMNFKGK